MNTGVYRITNKVNGKRYVGSAHDLRRRMSYHKTLLERNKHPNKHLQRAYNKYGKHAFEFEVLVYCDEMVRLSCEQKFIDELSPEYNNVKIAGSTLGYKHSDEARRKISVGLTGRKISDESKKKMSEAQQKPRTADKIPEKVRQVIEQYLKGVYELRFTQ